MIRQLAVILGLFCASTVVQAGPIQYINNGSFENGMTGWTVTASNTSTGGCDTGWVRGASGSATGCLGVTSPIDGSNAMYSSFDGNGPQFFNLTQRFNFLRASALDKVELSWLQTVSTSFSGAPREFNILLSGKRVYQQTYIGNQTTTWLPNAVDLTAEFNKIAFGSHTLDITFQLYIPQNFSGPAGFGLDKTSLLVSTKDIAPVTVPAPAGLLLFVLGLICIYRRSKG
jgi:hypothetical protein